MALTVDIIRLSKTSTLYVAIADITFDNSYPTGGEYLDPSVFGFGTIVLCLPQSGSGYAFEFDHTTTSLKAYRSAGHTHTENTAASYAQNATTASAGVGALSENSNPTALSGIKIRCAIFGY